MATQRSCNDILTLKLAEVSPCQGSAATIALLEYDLQSVFTILKYIF